MFDRSPGSGANPNFSPAQPQSNTQQALGLIALAERLRDEDQDMHEPGYFAYQTFDGLHLTDEQSALVDEIYNESSADARVKEIEGLFRSREDYFKLEHSQRVTRFGLMLAVAAGVDRFNLERLARALRAHDVGMVAGASDEQIAAMQAAIYKRGGLSPDERALVNMHPEWGRGVVDKLGFDTVEQAIVLGHHNPELVRASLSPQEHLLVVIAEIADITDARCSQRPYPKPFDTPQTAAPDVLSYVQPDKQLGNAYLQLVGLPLAT